MMMALGFFVFELKSTPLTKERRSERFNHPSTARINNTPAVQSTGTGDETRTLSGLLYPEITGGQVSLDELSAMGHSGKSWILINGQGFVEGSFAVEQIETTKTELWPNGSARKIEFSVTIKRTDEDRVEELGGIGAQIVGGN